MSTGSFALECHTCLNEGCENNTNSMEDCNQLEELVHKCVITSLNSKIDRRSQKLTNKIFI